MKAGSLDRTITLRRAHVSKDRMGTKGATWADLATVWASHQPVKDDERVRAAATGATITDRFQIRWSRTVADLSATDHLLFEGRLYQITAVKPIGRREGIEISATAIADRGAA